MLVKGSRTSVVCAGNKTREHVCSEVMMREKTHECFLTEDAFPGELRVKRPNQTVYERKLALCQRAPLCLQSVTSCRILQIRYLALKHNKLLAFTNLCY